MTVRPQATMAQIPASDDRAQCGDTQHPARADGDAAGEHPDAGDHLDARTGRRTAPAVELDQQLPDGERPATPAYARPNFGTAPREQDDADRQVGHGHEERDQRTAESGHEGRSPPAHDQVGREESGDAEQGGEHQQGAGDAGARWHRADDEPVSGGRRTAVPGRSAAPTARAAPAAACGRA